VITTLTADQDGALSLAACAMVGERDLERGIDRFGAGIGKKHMIEIARGEVTQ